MLLLNKDTERLTDNLIEECLRRGDREHANANLRGKSGEPFVYNEFIGSRAVTYKDTKRAQEKSAAHRRQLLYKWDGALVSASMNIPGAYKHFPLAALCFDECGRAAETALGAAGVSFTPQRPLALNGFGAAAFYLIKDNPEDVKRLLCGVEDTHPLGRLFNLDVYTGYESNKKIGRADLGIKGRTCLLCDGQALDCVSGRRHAAGESVSRMLYIMWKWARRNLAERVNAAAVRALCGELAATPKPGLVDRHNSGAHADMDYFTFIDSIAELLSYFQECALTGFDCAASAIDSRLRGHGGGNGRDGDSANGRYGDGVGFGDRNGDRIGDRNGNGNNFSDHNGNGDDGEYGYGDAAGGNVNGCDCGCNGREAPPLLDTLRRAGKLAEARMSRVTSGVNTHKGLIFSLGIMCAAYGWLIRTKTVFTPDDLFNFIKDIAAPVMRDFKDINEENAKTNGERLYAQCGVTGIRGEAAGGFANVRDYGLPTLRTMLQRGYSMNDAGVAAFVSLLSHVEDTTIIHRSSMATLRDIQRAAADFTASRPSMSDIKKWASETDLQFIERNITSGGCADLLAITFFIHLIFQR